MQATPLVPEATHDRRLMQRMRADDASALDEALQQYWGPLLALATRMTGSEAVAEDIVQETFVVLWERRTRWEPSDSLRPLLYRIARNRILDEQRNDRVRQKRLESLRLMEQVSAESPLEYAEAGELGAAVSEAIDSLPPRRREVFLLARHQSLTYRQISELMGISEQTVANQMCTAMSDLRRALKPYLEEVQPTRPTLRVAP